MYVHERPPVEPPSRLADGRRGGRSVLAARRGAQTPHAAPARNRRTTVALRWLGTSGWRLDAGGRTLLVDPYLSRFKTVAAMNAGTRVFGTLTTYHLGLAMGVPAAQLSPVKGGEVLNLDGCTVEVVASLHSRNTAYSMAFPGVRPARPEPPQTIADLPEGDTLAYQVTVDGGPSVYFMGGSGFVERNLTGRWRASTPGSRWASCDRFGSPRRSRHHRPHRDVTRRAHRTAHPRPQRTEKGGNTYSVFA
jgi:hypothetical protein